MCVGASNSDDNSRRALDARSRGDWRGFLMESSWSPPNESLHMQPIQAPAQPRLRDPLR